MQPVDPGPNKWIIILENIIVECDRINISRESPLGKAIVNAKISIELEKKRYSWTDDLYGDC